MSDKRIKGLAHVNLTVRDMDRSLDFYCNTLGFENIYEFSGMGNRCAFIKLSTCVIELHQCPEYDETLKDGHFEHIALAVEDIEGLAQVFREKGVRFETEAVLGSPRIWPNGSKWILFRGPDNELLELNEIL